MKKTKIFLLLSILSTFSFAEDFDYHEFMSALEKQKAEETKSAFSLDWFSNDEVDDEDKTYAEKKYGRKVKYQTYEEIKAERLKRNTLIMLGAEKRDLKITDKSDGYVFSDTGQVTDIDESKFTNSFETEYNATIYFSTLLDLKYFNIQEDVRKTYLGVGLGKYIDIDVQYDFTDGRTTDFYAMAGPILRVNLTDKDRLLDAGLQGTLGYFFTKDIGLFYQAKYTGESFISENFQYLIEKSGTSKHFDQFIYLGIKF